jgi:hypothetical protein
MKSKDINEPMENEEDYDHWSYYCMCCGYDMCECFIEDEEDAEDKN